jgi:WD40 repeat protein/ABC-type cobalamin/Fe3+-siderophores transport system ATPase subunit
VLRLGTDEFDAARFERLVADGQRRAAAHDLVAALTAFDEALGLWRGPAWAEFADEDFARADAVRLEELRALAIEERAESLLAAGRHAESIGELEAATAAHPLRERPRGQLMLALYRAGRQVEALRAYEAFRRFLAEEVGLEPSPALQSLDDAIAAQKPELDWKPRTVVAGADPRAGGRGGTESPGTVDQLPLPAALGADTAPLVGRLIELEWLEVLWGRAVAGQRAAACIVGPEGVGKSRLVAEFARRVHARGGTVMCRAGGSIADAVDAEAKDAASAARSGPLLVVIDPLDGAGPNGAGVFPRLGGALAGAGLLAVGVCRERPRDPPGNIREVGELGVEDVGVVLAQSAGPQPFQVAEAVWAETAGNPSLVTEVAARLRNRDAAVRVDRALSRADAVAADLRSLQDEIVGEVMVNARLAEPHRARGPTASTAVCPYKGLARFDTMDAPYFFGRERLVATMVARLAVARFVGVVGASGSGKSSLVRAGLLPALGGGSLPGSQDWLSVVCTPGAEPMVRLAEAISAVTGASAAELAARLDSDAEALDRTARGALRERPDARFVIVVDQFEELVTVCRDPARSQHFVTSLLDAVSEPDGRVVVVAVVRADYYGALSMYPELARLFERSQVLVGAMTESQLRRAVTEPAQRVGLRVQDGLVEAVCFDAGAEPGALPLVSTALLETWARRDGDTLTVAAYQDAGGVRGAVARLAEDVYATFDPVGQDDARRIFMRLAQPGEGGDDVRRRVQRSELAGGEHVDTVIAALVARRLLTADDGTVEVAHEALLREWPRLRGWLEADRDGRRLHLQLAQAAIAWDTTGRDPDGLFRGARLSAAQDWSAAHAADLNPIEHDFLDAAVVFHDHELHVARRSSRRLRMFAGALAVVLVVALVAGGVAWRQRDRASSQAAVARAQTRLAQASRLAAVSRTLGPDQTDLALLLAVQGRHLATTVETTGALEAVLARTPPGLERIIRYPSPSYYPVMTRDGHLLIVPGQDGAVRVFDTQTGQLLRTISGNASKAAAALPSLDDRLVALGGSGSTVEIRDLATGAPIGPPLNAGGTFSYGVLSQDDSRLYTVSDSGRVITWDRTDPNHPRQVGPTIMFSLPGQRPVAAVSPDGTLLSVGPCCEGSTLLFDLRSGRLLRQFPGADGAFSPDGRTMLTSQTDRLSRWDVGTGRPSGAPLTGFTGNGLPATSIAFSPDGTLLARGDADGAVRVFDLGTGRLVAQLTLHSTASLAIGFLPDGRLLTSGTNEAAIWHPRSTLPPIATALGGHTGFVYGYFVPGTRQAITLGGDDRQLLGWNIDDGTPLGPVLGGRAHYPLAVSPDGHLLAAGTERGRIGLYDRVTGDKLGELDGGRGGETVVAWSRATNVIASAANDQTVLVWDVADPRHPRLAQRLPVPGTAQPTAQSPIVPLLSADGHEIAVEDFANNAVTMYDSATGRARWSVSFPGASFGQAAFSPDAQTLVVDVGDNALGAYLAFYNTVTGLRQRTLQLPNWDGVAYVDGGRALLTTGGPAQLWDTATLEPIGAPVTLPVKYVRIAEPNRDGTMALLGSTEGSAFILQLDPAQWETTACRIAGRNLTLSEWQQYLSNRPYHPTCP